MMRTPTHHPPTPNLGASNIISPCIVIRTLDSVSQFLTVTPVTVTNFCITNQLLRILCNIVTGKHPPLDSQVVSGEGIYFLKSNCLTVKRFT